MTKNFYLITLKLQTPLPCKVLKEKRVMQYGKKMKDYLIELEKPLPKKTYLGMAQDDPAVKWQFYLHGWQPWPKTGPLWGTIGGTDRAFLCSSEEQAQKYLRFLDEAKQGIYVLIVGKWLPDRKCRIIQDLTSENGAKGWWLAEVSPPFPGKAFRQPNDFSRILIALDDLPAPGRPIIGTICYLHQNITIGNTVVLKKLGLKQVTTGTLWRPQDLVKKGNSYNEEVYG